MIMPPAEIFIARSAIIDMSNINLFSIIPLRKAETINTIIEKQRTNISAKDMFCNIPLLVFEVILFPLYLLLNARQS